MTATRNRRPPLELRWDKRRPLPARWVVREGAPALPAPAVGAGFDFTAAIRGVCSDVAERCPELAHVEMSRVLVTFTPSRNRSRYGLQARVTPLRFRAGRLTRVHGATEYQVQRFFVDGREMLYVLTFCLPRFLDQSFREKLITVFHELYHIGPAFDGDLRRHPGRCALHSRSKEGYDARMGTLADEYLCNHSDPDVFRFLRSGYRDLWSAHGGVSGVVVPRPKLLPVGVASAHAARRSEDGDE
ncbi:MAG: hypothetical protein K2V38_20050 [Gemmataceae bacterium]|nr:hypothetical protein [Gemmataceae bacterium]